MVTLEALIKIGPDRYSLANTTVQPPPPCEEQDATARAMASESSVLPSPAAPNASGVVAYAAAEDAARARQSASASRKKSIVFFERCGRVYIISLYNNKCV
jgi:hypothetical protein